MFYHQFSLLLCYEREGVSLINYAVIVISCNISIQMASQSLAVNTRTVLAIVPPQGCEAILVENTAI